MTSSDIVQRLRGLQSVHLARLHAIMEEAADEIGRLRLTDAEREAVADAADRYAEITPESAETAATLRGLLERLA